jgi:hypothetical protein
VNPRTVHTLSFRLAIGVVLVLTAAAAQPPAHADEWISPQIKEVFSQSREWFVRVTPGTSVGETVGFAGAPKGKHATAEFYRRAPYREPALKR